MTSDSSCPAVPPEVAAAVPEVGAWVAAGRAVLSVVAHAEEWDAGTRHLVLGEVDRVERIAALARAKVVAAEQAAGTWALRGDRDLAGFVGRQSRQGRGAGWAAVGQAGTLAALPVVAEALVDGPVTPRHLQEIARATGASPALAAELASPEGQAQVVELARRLDGGGFGKALAQLSASLDPAARQRSHDEQRAERSFAWMHTSGGTVLKGRLDSVAGHKLAKVIEALCPRPALDDERTREQRQADALVGMVERAAADRATTPGAIAPVQAVVTLTQETWAALRAVREPGVEGARLETVGGVGARSAGSTACTPSAASTPSSGSAADLVARLQAVPPVVDETDRPWPASEIGRALCDCALTRAVVGALGEPLDLGRGERLFQRQHWLALYGAGVRTCAFPGCGIPLRHTELHHLRWWDRDGGRTDIANCAPYCSYHHHQIHRQDIRVTRLSDGTLEHHHPDGRLIGDRLADAELPSRPDGRLSDDAHVTGVAPPGSAPVSLSPVGADEGGPPSSRAHRSGSGSADPPDDLLCLLTA